MAGTKMKTAYVATCDCEEFTECGHDFHLSDDLITAVQWIHVRLGAIMNGFRIDNLDDAEFENRILKELQLIMEDNTTDNNFKIKLAVEWGRAYRNLFK